MAAASIEPLTVDDLDGALALSAAAHWNQNLADWRLMLEIGRGWGIHLDDDEGRRTLAASTVVLPWGDDFAWVSMVLVLPSMRRRGLASRLLRHALDDLASGGRSAVLDATPDGRAVYLGEGFVDDWTFARWRRPGGAAAPSTAAPRVCLRPLADADWPAIAVLDAPAFGADRTALLRRLAGRLPGAAHVAEADGRLRGAVFGREGRVACQIGPLLADDEATAAALFAAALAAIDGPVVADLVDGREVMRSRLESSGFVFERPFTRMVRGMKKAPGETGAVVLVAGPELG